MMGQNQGRPFGKRKAAHGAARSLKNQKLSVTKEVRSFKSGLNHPAIHGAGQNTGTRRGDRVWRINGRTSLMANNWTRGPEAETRI